jgi:hypothetical protein
MRRGKSLTKGDEGSRPKFVSDRYRKPSCKNFKNYADQPTVSTLHRQVGTNQG